MRERAPRARLRARRARLRFMRPRDQRGCDRRGTGVVRVLRRRERPPRADGRSSKLRRGRVRADDRDSAREQGRARQHDSAPRAREVLPDAKAPASLRPLAPRRAKFAGDDSVTRPRCFADGPAPSGEGRSWIHLQEGPREGPGPRSVRSEEHTSELQSRQYLVCRLLLEKKKTKI